MCFAVGFISGRVLGHHGPPKPPHVVAGDFANPYRAMRQSEMLSPEAREQFRTSLRESLPSLREQHMQLREARRELHALYKAPDFDRAAIEQKLDEIEQAERDLRAASSEAYLNAIEALPAEERRKLFLRSEERRKRRERRRHGN